MELYFRWLIWITRWTCNCSLIAGRGLWHVRTDSQCSFRHACPFFGGNEPLNLIHTLFRQRMGAKIAFNPSHCDLGELLVRAPGLQHIFMVQMLEPFEQMHRAL